VGARAHLATSKWIWSLEPVVQGRVAFLATSERIWSPEQPPSTRVQGLRKGRHKVECGRERADLVARAGHKGGWWLSAVLAGVDSGIGLGGPQDSVGFS
jgi:hypothetical protein